MEWEFGTALAQKPNMLIVKMGLLQLILQKKCIQIQTYTRSSDDHYVNKSEMQLRKIIVTVIDNLGNQIDTLFVQYYFEVEEKQVKVLPHGNAIRLRPFVRTNESTKNDIKFLS